MRTILIACILITTALPALAVGKVTTDPNAPGATAPADEVAQKSDARLAKRVTIDRIKTPLRKILDELSKSTGVVLKAGVNNGDWQVRDRKMNIFGEDVPLAQIMNSISHVMKFKWDRKGEPGKWTYRLYMDRRTLLSAEAQRARAEEKEDAERTRRRKGALDAFGKLSSLSAEEKAALLDKNPFLYAVSRLGWGDSIGDFFRQVPAVAEALSSGQMVSIDSASLAPGARTSILNALLAELTMEKKFGGGSQDTPLPDKIDPAKIMISVNDSMDRMPQQMQGVLLGEVRLKCSAGNITIPLINPENEFARYMGKLMLEAETSGRTLDEVGEERESEVAAMMTHQATAEAGGEPVNEHPDDPALHAKVKLQPDSPALFNVQLDLAHASGLCVVSDHFPGPDGRGEMPQQGPPSGEVELKKALDTIADIYIYNWDKRDGVLEFRDRNWFRKRTLQIPDAWLNRWRDELKTTGTIGLDNLSQIAQLTQEQLSANVMYDDDFRASNLAGIVVAGREPLRFYASLQSDQRSALLTDFGLDAATLSPDQSDLLSTLLATRGQKLSSDKSAVVTCTKRQTENGVLYTFALRLDGKLNNEWNVSSITTFLPPAPEAKKTPPPAARPDHPAR